MKNPYALAIALIGTATIAKLADRFISNDHRLSPRLRARIMTMIDGQCSEVLSLVAPRP
jgi:hypothetical protein